MMRIIFELIVCCVVMSYTAIAVVGPENVFLEDAILEDMLPQNYHNNPHSMCHNPGGTVFDYEDTVTFDSTRWDGVSSQWEQDAFIVQMKQTDGNDYQNMEIRFGHGGNIYSIYNDKYEEAIPPQGMEYAPFIDEVLQMVAVNLTQFSVNQDAYIHQAGTYLFRNEKAPDVPTGIPPPFYSPSLAKRCNGHVCRFASWGQQAHVPNSYRSDILFFHQYTNCGNGTVEYTQLMQYIGNGPRSQYYINTPWTGVRTSHLPDMMFSATDGTLLGKVFPMPQWGQGIVTNSETTGGFTTFARVGKDIDPPPNSLAVPCVNPDGSADLSCSNGSSQTLKFLYNGGCTSWVKNDYNLIRCHWPRNPHDDNGPLSVFKGCQSCGQEMMVRDKLDPSRYVNVTYVLEWNRNGRITFESSYCTYISCPNGHAEAVNAVNNLFDGGTELEFIYNPDPQTPFPFEESPSLTFVHGKGWGDLGANQNLQYGQGGGASRRDMTTFVRSKIPMTTFIHFIPFSHHKIITISIFLPMNVFYKIFYKIIYMLHSFQCLF